MRRRKTETKHSYKTVISNSGKAISLIFHLILNQGTISGTETGYPSGAVGFTPRFLWGFVLV